MRSENVCAACEGASRECDAIAARIREDEQRAHSRIVNNPSAVERRGQSVEMPLIRRAAEIAALRMVAEQCAAAIRSACTHARPDAERKAKLEALLSGPCPACGGQGWYSASEHDPGCMGDCRNCPVEVQVQCHCVQARLDALAAALREEVSR